METVSNLTSAASRAIWGDPDKDKTSNETGGQEPLSGEVGDVSAGEPYDKGNADSTTTEPTVPPTSTGSDSIPIHSKTDDKTDNTTSGGAANTDLPGNTPTTAPIRPEHDTDKTGVTSAHNPTSATSSDKPTSSNDNSGPGAAPSVGADPASGAQPTTKQQGADKPTSEPSSAESDRIKETKKEAEDAAKVDVSGPGPKTLEEKAKEGGAAGAGKADDGDDGPQKESKGEGTGEKYVKSSGMKADGGDFDAANPGAGKEADRLLESKGVHHSQPGEPKSEDLDKGKEAGKSPKPSLKEKIKAKLHRNKDDKD